ncbi:MAG: hypothetical protein ACSHYB_17990 [Roseibacillus sp.]
MEFKVIFIGFALHCVLNTVLICKSVITKGQEAQAEIVITEKENEMFQAINDTPGDIKRLRLQVDNSSGENVIRLKQ